MDDDAEVDEWVGGVVTIRLCFVGENLLVLYFLGAHLRIVLYEILFLVNLFVRL
jgi:hypothetical protein